MNEIEENSKKNRILSEFNRIFELFENSKENEKAVLFPLIQNAAFMRVTLEDLQEIINRDGVVDRYQNGQNQFGTKQSAALQAYTALQKSYASVIRELIKMLPYGGTTKSERLLQQKLTAAENAQKQLWDRLQAMH